MPYDLSNTLVIGISSRSLFDLELENRIFDQEGVKPYQEYQIDHEDEPPPKGTAFHLVEGLLKLNRYNRGNSGSPPIVEVVIMSRNDAGIGLRIFNAIEHYKLDISRAAFTSGTSLAHYLEAFEVDLFLSKYRDDVVGAFQGGVASALVREPPDEYKPATDKIRIAFDGDAVIFSDEAERIFKEEGMDAFLAHERANAEKALPEGPFGKLFMSLAKLQQTFQPDKRPIRLALVTARNAPAHERVIRTLREWNVSIDEAFFLGGVTKDKVLKAFRAHIFFDDQSTHVDPASRVVPSGQVPGEENKETETPPTEG